MAAVPDTAMVMAAGLGTRMRPLTATCPKPLIPVAGKPLIDHVLDRLRAAGVRRVVVNVHYLADLMQAHLADVPGLEIVVSDERTRLLETGGGLVHALPLLGTEPFLVINADNLWLDGAEDTLRQLAAGWRDDAMDALLLLVPRGEARNHGGRGDFSLDPAGRLIRRASGAEAPFVYSGIQIASPRLVEGWAAGAFSTNLMWDRAIAADRVFGAVHDGLWFDVGTPDAVAATNAMLRRG